MKIAYIDYYVKGQSQHKDPLTIPFAMKQLGCEIVLISCNDLSEVGLQLHGFEVLPLVEVEARGWKSYGFNGVVFATRLDAKFTRTVRNIHESGLRLVIKADTDGTWGYPIPPNYLRARPMLVSPVNVLRHLKWRLPLKYGVAGKIDQLYFADAVVVESPGAAVNATSVLLHWGQANLARKLHFIPNPVSPDALSLPINEQKGDRIVVVGRWEDRGVKNTQTMLRTVEKFLATNIEFDFEIIGSGLDEDEVRKYLGKDLAAGRVSVIPEIPYKNLQERIGQAKVVLIPSTLESFCFVAIEALCAGASIVVTPIESLIYIAGGGRWGSVARGFDREHILAALTYEIQAWKLGLRNSEKISEIARKEFQPHNIAMQYVNLFK